MTDLFQSLLMFAAVFSVAGCSLWDAGLEEIIDTANRNGRLQFFETSIDPTVRHTLWTQVFGGCFVYLSLYAVNQAQVQRLLTLPSLKRAQVALCLQVPILIVLSFATSFAGLCIFHRFQGCDPLASGQIRSPDQLFPLYIVDRMSSVPGLPGLAVAGIFFRITKHSLFCNQLPGSSDFGRLHQALHFHTRFQQLARPEGSCPWFWLLLYWPCLPC